MATGVARWGDGASPSWDTLRAVMHRDVASELVSEPRTVRPRRPVRASLHAHASLRAVAPGPSRELLWAHPPDRMRTERWAGDRRLAVTLDVAGRRQAIDGNGRILREEAVPPLREHPFLFPATFRDHVEVVAHRRVTVSGRFATEVRARPMACPVIDVAAVGTTGLVAAVGRTDELRVVLDDEHGVALDLELRGDGSRLARLALHEVRFDESIEAWRFEPATEHVERDPEIRRVRRIRHPDDVPVQVPFTVHVPTWPEEVVRATPSCHLRTATDLPPELVLTYPMWDGRRHVGNLWLHQTGRRPDEALTGEATEAIDDGGDGSRHRRSVHLGDTTITGEVTNRSAAWFDRLVASLTPLRPS